jgi:hypothetical protein
MLSREQTAKVRINYQPCDKMSVLKQGDIKRKREARENFSSH